MSLSDELMFEGEDLAYGSGLYVDLVPRGSWGQNLRAVMTKSEWAEVSAKVSARCGGVCEACGHAKPRIECHERWSCDPGTQVQTLRRLVGLCASCHRATHFGFAQAMGRGAQALAQLQKTNRWTKQQALSHVADAFREWEVRSRIAWIVDFPLSLCPKLRKKVEALPDPRSPCVRVCRLEDGLCAGCGRTPEEISSWSTLPERAQKYLTLRILAGTS